MPNILITGGTGRLAAELKKHLEGDYCGIEHWDFIYEVPKKDYDLVLHMGAYTDVKKAETEKEKCMLTNVMGTFNMVETYRDTPFIYISTEWAENPLGIYALSKKLGEEIVMTHPRYLILRTLFKPNPWPFEFAYENQWTQGDYVDVIAEILADKVKNLTENSFSTEEGVIEYLGTERKTILELAQRTKPNVKPNRVEDYRASIGMDIIPFDYE